MFFLGKLREPQTSAEGNHDNLLSGNHQARGSLSSHNEDHNKNIKWSYEQKNALNMHHAF